MPNALSTHSPKQAVPRWETLAGISRSYSLSITGDRLYIRVAELCAGTCRTAVASFISVWGLRTFRPSSKLSAKDKMPLVLWATLPSNRPAEVRPQLDTQTKSGAAKDLLRTYNMRYAACWVVRLVVIGM